MRIVLDANILVRANTRSQGPAREALNLIRSDEAHVLICSRQILEEVGRTLLYPRLQVQFRLSPQDIEEHIRLLQTACRLVEPVVKVPVVRNDPDDDIVLYTAVEGRADVLCTWDRDFYTPEVSAFCQQSGIEVMNDVELLSRLRST